MKGNDIVQDMKTRKTSAHEIEKAKRECNDLIKEVLDMADFDNNPAIGQSWEEVEKELFTPAEIAASDLRVALICELIKARNERGISQKKLEEMSGVKQPVIARMERGITSPQLDTVLKVLNSLGKTLAVVPLEKSDS